MTTGKHDSWGPSTPGEEMSGEESAREICKRNPNRALLCWKSLERDIVGLPKEVTSLGGVELSIRAMRDIFREWFEDQGHWRDLDPNAKDLSPDNNKRHIAEAKQISRFVEERTKRVQTIEYQNVKCDHREEPGGSVHYRWIFCVTDEPVLILEVDAGNVVPPHNDPLKRTYFRNSTPSGYAIFQGEEFHEGTVYFSNHDCIPIVVGFDARFKPQELSDFGDYELRMVSRGIAVQGRSAAAAVAATAPRAVKRTFVFKDSFCQMCEGKKVLARIRAGKTTAVVRELYQRAKRKNAWVKWSQLKGSIGFTRDNPKEFFARCRAHWAVCEAKPLTKAGCSDWEIRLNPAHDYRSE